MASYPSALYNPSAKAAGNTIQASFFNDPEAEIIAVENALLNGIAHPVTVAGAVTVSSGGLTVSSGGLTVSTGSVNIGGPSSLATLQVNGGSTLAALTVTSTASFASSVTFAGNVTVAGTLTAAAVSIGTLIVPSVRLTIDADQLFSLGGAEFGPTWNSQLWSVGGMHSTSVNSSRITFADSTGLYQIGVCLATQTGGDSGQAGMSQRLRFRYNDTTTLGSANCVITNGGGVVGSMLTDTVRVQSTTDYVTLRVSMTDGVASTGRLVAASSIAGTFFWAMKVSG